MLWQHLKIDTINCMENKGIFKRNKNCRKSDDSSSGFSWSVHKQYNILVTALLVPSLMCQLKQYSIFKDSFSVKHKIDRTDYEIFKTFIYRICRKVRIIV